MDRLTDLMMFPMKRRQVTEVVARRADGSAPPPAPGLGNPVVIDAASTGVGAGPVATPSGVSPGPTQIFVIAPGSAPAPATATPPPTEVHHHHTTVQYVARKRTPAYNTSFFGSAGLVLGFLSALAAYEAGPYLWLARPLALAGFIAGGLGLLGAVFLGRTRIGLSILALLLSAGGFVGWMYDNGQLQSQLDELHTQFPQVPKVDLGQAGDGKR